MKKTFLLESPGQAPARVIESIKNDIRKYLKRERRKPLPEGVDFWDFDCRVGPDSGAAVTAHLKEVNPAIDAVGTAGSKSVYVEILAKPGHRSPRAEGRSGEPGEHEGPDPDDDFHG